jgi:hypothetical protein
MKINNIFKVYPYFSLTEKSEIFISANLSHNFVCDHIVYADAQGGWINQKIAGMIKCETDEAHCHGWISIHVLFLRNPTIPFHRWQPIASEN